MRIGQTRRERRRKTKRGKEKEKLNESSPKLSLNRCEKDRLRCLNSKKVSERLETWFVDYWNRPLLIGLIFWCKTFIILCLSAHTNLKVFCTYAVHSWRNNFLYKLGFFKLVWSLMKIKLFLNYFVPLFCSNAFALHRKNLVHASWKGMSWIDWFRNEKTKRT